MKNILVLTLVGALALSGCNQATTAVTTANNTLATLAKNEIPLACSIIKTAEGYYTQIVGAPSAPVATAEATVALICANPPTDLTAAFATLLNAWTLIQSATVKP